MDYVYDRVSLDMRSSKSPVYHLEMVRAYDNITTAGMPSDGFRHSRVHNIFFVNETMFSFVGRARVFLELSPCQVPDHLLAREPGGTPQSRHVQGARQPVGEAKEQHRRDPPASILEREAALGHLVLLDGATAKVVDGAGWVNLGLVLPGDVGGLGSGKDVEVIVGGVTAAVAFSTDGGAEDDKVFGDA